jgi:hypothetical protein
MRSCLGRLAGTALLAIAGSWNPEPAGAQGLDVSVEHCEPHPVDPFLRRALVRVRTADQPVSFADLRCGSFVPGTADSLFLNGVDGLGILPPHTSRVAKVLFPGDALHSECRCTLGDPAAPVPPETVLRGTGVQPRGTRDEDFWGGGWRGGPAGRLPVLREERVLAPVVPVRQTPEADADEIAQLNGGDRVVVLAVAGGWKQVRTAQGREGWIPDDAATSEPGAPEAIARSLAPLRARLAAGREQQAPGSLCSALTEGALDPLLFALLPELRSAYVRSLWYALVEADRDAVRRYLDECYGVTRIVEIGSGQEVRSSSGTSGKTRSRREAPSSRLAFLSRTDNRARS